MKKPIVTVVLPPPSWISKFYALSSLEWVKETSMYKEGFVPAWYFYDLNPPQILLADFQEPSAEQLSFALSHEYIHYILQRDFDLNCSFQFDGLRYKHPPLNREV